MSFKRFIAAGIGAVFICSALAGCGGADTGEEQPEESAQTSESQTEDISSESESGETAGDSSDTEYTQEVFAMDTYMTLTAYGENAEEAVEAGIAEIERLDALWSTGDEDSEVAQINAAGGGEMSEETAYLVQRALEIYESTGGAFDISIYPVMDLWGFTTGNFAVPDENTLAETLALVDASRISVTDNVLSMDEGMQIDLGGIAKGYTSGRVMEIFEEYGIESAVINLGGNAQVLGNKTDGSQWRVGIQDPEDTEGYLGGIAVTNKAVITSGGYERYFDDEETGIRYHHIIDPKTGYSANNGLISVTIISEDSTLADGLSTSLFVLGTEDAITYCEEHCAADGFDVVLEDEDGTLYMTDTIEDSFINLNDTTNIEIIKTSADV